METKKKRARVVVSVLALAGLAVFPLMGYAGSLEPSAPPGPTMKTLDEVEPRIPIPGSAIPLEPFQISRSGSYYLTGDRAATANGINVNADSVTIDLMGYSLIGPGSASGVNYGILMSCRKNVEVRNGTVRDFGRSGIREMCTGGYQHRIINVRAEANGYVGINLSGTGHLVKDCTARANAHGISVAVGGTMMGNTVYYNQGTGIQGVWACTLTDNTASYNAGTGIRTDYGCTVTNNTAYRNDANGIRAEAGCTVTGNTVTENNGNGIHVQSNCKVVANTCCANGRYGDGAGIHATSRNNRIQANNLLHNDRGVDVDGAGNIIVKNTASDNTPNYEILPGNAYGPIVDVNGVGDISATADAGHPWANFEF
ncbi:MAG: right-handed parallel beta-helix repeat-containing protein [Planctomycetota bacterium]|jgi:parallel beta-helix repeat protein